MDLYNRFRDYGQKGVVIRASAASTSRSGTSRASHFGVPIHRRCSAARSAPRSTPMPPALYRRETGDPLDYLVEEAPGYVARGLQGREAEDRLRRRGGRRAHRAPCAQAIGPRRRPDARRQPRLRRDRGDRARPRGRGPRHRLVRGAGAARRPRQLPRGAARPADPDRRRRVRVHALGLPRGVRAPRHRHRAAGHLRGRRPVRVQEDRRHGRRLRRPLRAARLGHGHRRSPPRCSCSRSCRTCRRRHYAARADAGVRPHGASVPPGDPARRRSSTCAAGVDDPDGPGLGIEIDRDALERFRVA